ncbi:unnamed protein product, partial [Prorocentrum cordatum]
MSASWAATLKSHHQRLVHASSAERRRRAARLDKTTFLASLRSAKKGTAAGPSGVRAEHLKPLLEHEESMDLQGFVAVALAEARICHGQRSAYLWQDKMGTCARRAEQGDALAPALVALALRGALAGASKTLEQGHFLVAILDDVYIKTTRARARAASDTTAGAIYLHAHVNGHLGKCREIAEYARGHDGDMWATLRRLLADPAMSQDDKRRARALAAMRSLGDTEDSGSKAAEPGEGQHGWQSHACSARNTHYRDNVFMPSLTGTNQGHVFKPARFLAALRRRLRGGWHRPRTFDTDGAALLVAERRDRDSLQLVRLLAKQKARAAPALLRRSAELAYTNRWWGFLSVAAQGALMATLTGDGHLALGGAAGEDDPDLAEVLLA